MKIEKSSRRDVRKEILALLETGELTTDDIAKRLKIAQPSARHHLVKLQKQGVIHVSRCARMTYRANFTQFFALGAGEDVALPPLGRLRKLSETVTPPRHELTTALFGAVPERFLSKYESHVYCHMD